MPTVVVAMIEARKPAWRRLLDGVARARSEPPLAARVMTWRELRDGVAVTRLTDRVAESSETNTEIPQRFYVEVGGPKANRASVMDRLELARKKDVRGRKPANIQAVALVQGVQAVESSKNSRSPKLKQAR